MENVLGFIDFLCCKPYSIFSGIQAVLGQKVLTTYHYHHPHQCPCLEHLENNIFQILQKSSEYSKVSSPRLLFCSVYAFIAILNVLTIFNQCTFIFKNSDLCKAKDSDACLKASGKNWAKYTCSSSTKWCTSWAKDMKRCCPESCKSGSFFESDCEKDGGKGICIYPNEAQPDETPCKKGKDDFIVLIVISLNSVSQ